MRLTPLFAGLLVLASATLAANAASAETVLIKTYGYFTVGGKTAEDLDRELLTRGPMAKSTGHRHPGVTQIHFSGSVSYRDSGSSCAVDSVQIKLTTKIILPRWTNRKRATRSLGIVWDTLAADIKRHEERHAEIARNHARAMEKQILALPAQDNCDEMKQRVAMANEAALTAHAKDQVRFDRVEAVNFENRMMRLLKYRVEKK